MKKELEKIRLIEEKEEETSHEMTFSMLLAHVSMNRLINGKNYQLLKVGAYKCKFEVLEENFKDE